MITITATDFEIGEYSENGYHDSYFYAITYNTQTRKFGSVQKWTTAGAGYTEVPTATPEIREAARVRLVEILTAAKLDDARTNRLAPVKGAEVRSLTTRGKNKDMVGIVKWIGEDSYRRGELRVGVKVEGEAKLRYLPADRVDATSPAPIDFRAIYRAARVTARHAHANGDWYNALRSICTTRNFHI